ncbi:hypothetical protein J2S49_001017 [Arcanobacterium wilhelmae]|uniref:Uncharacterized protein n=1 Tax=Arcanobacterium wilhelmae TaxID=1803177 RepID=A0ABT9NC30_9ACTO|nr:DUF1963 domain-containing protein [Arcanobacterium wilhelmae]MDP9800941.1 hypothetical protein [Arcanobacterium wilhelmae]WFN90301.1 DUF1963 domain-containing protein [Arcanobacterium wilhelmae]
MTRTAYAFVPASAPTSTFAGGMLYLRPGESVPTDDAGAPLALLIQIDLEAIEPRILTSGELGTVLPTSGFLQVFHATDALMGMKLADENPNPYDGTGCVLVRHVTDVVDTGEPSPLAAPGEAEVYAPVDTQTRLYLQGNVVQMRPFLGTLEFDEAQPDFWDRVERGEIDEESEPTFPEYPFYLGDTRPSSRAISASTTSISAARFCSSGLPALAEPSGAIWEWLECGCQIPRVSPELSSTGIRDVRPSCIAVLIPDEVGR